MSSDTLFELTADLRAMGGGRVWSLMISLFGDLAQGKGDSIDGPVLSLIMAALDIRPEATRVALHRLRNDGWILSEKSGRISKHSLTSKGRAESAMASPRIYARPDAGVRDWVLVLLQTADADQQKVLVDNGFVQLLPRVYLGSPDADVPETALVLPGRPAPGWLCDQIAPGVLTAEYTKLHAILAALAINLPSPEALTPKDAAVLRCLVVHNWRRLVLKHPRLPRGLIHPDSPMLRCHVIVDDLLSRVPRPSLAAIARKTGK